MMYHCREVVVISVACENRVTQTACPEKERPVGAVLPHTREEFAIFSAHSQEELATFCGRPLRIGGRELGTLSGASEVLGKVATVTFVEGTPATLLLFEGLLVVTLTLHGHEGVT